MFNKVVKIAIAVLMIVSGIIMILNGSLDPQKGRCIIGAVIAFLAYKAMGRYCIGMREAQA